MRQEETQEAYLRRQLKQGIARCTEDEIMIFKRMYSHKDLEASICDVIDRMEATKLPWALKQVENTLAKRDNPSPVLP
jgi:hypothetical protein